MDQELKDLSELDVAVTSAMVQMQQNLRNFRIHYLKTSVLSPHNVSLNLKSARLECAQVVSIEVSYFRPQKFFLSLKRTIETLHEINSGASEQK